MMMMMLHAKVQQAKRLKRIIAAISGVERYGRMTIREDCMFVEVMNTNHRVPVSLFLNSAWFDLYNFTLGNPSSSAWTILLDLSMFNYLLSLANDDDQVDIHALSDSDFNRFYLLFDHQESGVRFHEMLFWRTLSVDMSRMRDMENAYSHGFRVVMPPHHLAHVLRRSMASHSPVNIDITSSMIMLSSGAAIRFLEQGLQCTIQNFPNGGFFCLELCLYVADCFFHAACIAKSIVIKVANPGVTRELPPSMCVSIEKFATLHFFLGFNSAVQPQIKYWSCLQESTISSTHTRLD